MTEDYIKMARADCECVVADLVEQIKERNSRIAELEAALNNLMIYGCPACNGDCSSANPPVIGCPMEAARAAYLGEKE